MAVADFTFDAELASAATIPSTWYRDPLLLEREQDRIFARRRSRSTAATCPRGRSPRRFTTGCFPTSC